MNTLNLKISGITCEACIKLIMKKIGKICGVTNVLIKNKIGETTVTSEQMLKVSDIVSSLKDLPYKVQE